MILFIRNLMVAIIYSPGVIAESIRLHRKYPFLKQADIQKRLCRYIQKNVPFK